MTKYLYSAGDLKFNLMAIIEIETAKALSKADLQASRYVKNIFICNVVQNSICIMELKSTIYM